MQNSNSSPSLCWEAKIMTVVYIISYIITSITYYNINIITYMYEERKLWCKPHVLFTIHLTKTNCGFKSQFLIPNTIKSFDEYHYRRISEEML